MDVNTFIRKATLHLGIERLNEMQMSMLNHKLSNKNVVLYAPTGSGKTLSYALRLLADIERKDIKPVAVIIVPTRELAIQTHSVLRTLADEMKVTCCYGGHSASDESRSLSVTPDIVLSTPGRLLDHFNRGNITLESVEHVVIDEFDKILELGFLEEVKALMNALSGRRRIILTSATKIEELPHYLYIRDAVVKDYCHSLNSPSARFKVWSVKTTQAEQMVALQHLLLSLPESQSVVFVNRRETADSLYRYLIAHDVSSVLYHGGQEQIAREHALARFYTRSAMVLVTTDLASRGLDMKDVAHIIHYDIPEKEAPYIHRNGRTARVDAKGDVYVMLNRTEDLPAFVKIDEDFDFSSPCRSYLKAPMQMLHIKAGRKEKVSRGDILGFILNASDHITADDIGTILVFDHYSLVGIKTEKTDCIFHDLTMQKIKGRRVRVSRI